MISPFFMNRRTGQIFALLSITVLVFVAIWYQNSQDTRLQTSLLSGQYGYGYGNTAPGPAPSSPTTSSLAENRPQFSGEENGVIVHKYFVPYDELTVLDGLQVSLFVPSLSTPVEWSSANTEASSIIVDDMNAARTAFITPNTEQSLHFNLAVENSSGVYETVARYEFTVLSPLAYRADVNLDGKYDFQNDLVNLLRNWDSFGADATRTLAFILSRLEE